jgi:hypothetical protein
LTAVDANFGDDVDYAMLIKLYGADPQAEVRYSPAKCIGARKEPKIGPPEQKHISTSYVERSNLMMRMHMRRFTRQTNAFSKKGENHAAAIALHTMYCNFVRIHQTLKVTPAMAAGVTAKLWEASDIVVMLEPWELQLRSIGRAANRASLPPVPLQEERTRGRAKGCALSAFLESEWKCP